MLRKVAPWAEQAFGEQPVDLQLPERRQAVVPLRHHDRQPLRALAFEIMQRQLKSVGIELVARFQVAGTLFGTTLPSGDWDLVMFTWVGSPSTRSRSRTCTPGGDQNYMNYCNKKLTAIMNKRLAVELDAAKRAQMLNSTELKHMVKDIPSIPLFARPIYVIRANTVKARWSTRPGRQPLERRKLVGVSQPPRR